MDVDGVQQAQYLRGIGGAAAAPEESLHVGDQVARAGEGGPLDLEDLVDEPVCVFVSGRKQGRKAVAPAWRRRLEHAIGIEQHGLDGAHPS